MYRIGQEEIDAVGRAILSRDFFKINSAGKEVHNFEEEWKKLTGAKYALTMTSGFAALSSALIGMGIGPGDEVIVPAYTYIASALAITSVGAIPVIAEVDDTLTIDVADVEKKLSPHTKAVMPVYIQGFPADLDALTALAKKHGFKIIEDACQADGGTYHGRYLGTIGDAGAYSFNYFKVITSGEGGALVTGDRTIYERGFLRRPAFGHRTAAFRRHRISRFRPDGSYTARAVKTYARNTCRSSQEQDAAHETYVCGRRRGRKAAQSPLARY